MKLSALFVTKAQKAIVQAIEDANGRAVTRTQLSRAIGRLMQQQDFDFIDRLVEAGVVSKQQDEDSKIWNYSWIGE